MEINDLKIGDTLINGNRQIRATVLDVSIPSRIFLIGVLSYEGHPQLIGTETWLSSVGDWSIENKVINLDNYKFRVGDTITNPHLNGMIAVVEEVTRDSFRIVVTELENSNHHRIGQKISLTNPLTRGRWSLVKRGNTFEVGDIVFSNNEALKAEVVHLSTNEDYMSITLIDPEAPYTNGAHLIVLKSNYKLFIEPVELQEEFKQGDIVVKEVGDDTMIVLVVRSNGTVFTGVVIDDTRGTVQIGAMSDTFPKRGYKKTKLKLSVSLI